MKIVRKNALCFILFFFSIFSVIAKGNPPAPTQKVPPPPPFAPIDENIFLLMIIALLFGLYIIYNFKIKQNTPM
jgi:hypothetical protein